MMTIQEVTSAEQFNTLRVTWDTLLKNSGTYSPFLTHDWFRCCLASYGQEKHLFILVVRNESDVVGIAPLWQYQDCVRNIPVKEIGFILCPDTPFVDFIVKGENRKEVLNTLLRHLCNEKKDIWDVLTLGYWPAESPNRRTLEELLPGQRRSFFARFTSQVPYIPIQRPWDSFLQARSARFRKTHRNIINRMSRFKNLETRLFREDPTGAAFRRVLSVSERSWKQKDGVAIANREEAKRFFESLTIVAGERGWLLIWLLETDGIPIAAEYDLEYEGEVFALRADFDEAYEEYSPGTYLQYQIIKRLFENGYRGYSSGPGTNSYKLRWTDEIKENLGLQVYNSNYRGWMVSALENGVIPFLKRIKPIYGTTK